MVAAPSKMLGSTAGPACRVKAQQSLLGSLVLGSVSSMPRRKVGVSKLRMRHLSPLGLRLVKRGESPKNLCLSQRWPKYHCKCEYHTHTRHILVQAYTHQFSVFPVLTLKAQLVCVTSDMTFHYTWLLLEILKKWEAISSTLLTQKCKTIL